MRISVIETPRGPRFYWHTISGDEQTWVLFNPEMEGGELTVLRGGVVVYVGTLGKDTFGPLTCLRLTKPDLLGTRHRKLYASLFEVGDELILTEDKSAGRPAPNFDYLVWRRLIGIPDYSRILYRMHVPKLESAA